MEKASRILDDPINLSLASGSVVIIFSLIILPKVRPEFITTLDNKNKPVIDHFRLVIFSVLLGASMAICVLLYVNQGRIIEESGESKSIVMPFPRFGISF